jgi:hypothetical protein
MNAMSASIVLPLSTFCSLTLSGVVCYVEAILTLMISYLLIHQLVSVGEHKALFATRKWQTFSAAVPNKICPMLAIL